MPTPILSAHNLNKSYPTPLGAIPVIKNISVMAQSGEFLCFVGPSGCGKTTLLRLLAGLQQPDAGEVRLKGQNLTGPHADMAVVFQKANLMPWRTVLENALLPLQVQKITGEAAQKQAESILDLVGLADFMGHYPHQLSGGMQQRVAIARAYISDPKVLLLDEPFGALDAMTREKLNQELLRLWQVKQKTILMVTHDINEAVYLADRILVLSQRPALIATEIPVTLARPRSPEILYHPDFTRLAYQVRQAIQL